MKKLLQFLIIAVAVLGAAIMLQPGWFTALAPYAPARVQAWLWPSPAAESGAAGTAEGTGKKSAQGQSGASSAGSSDRRGGAPIAVTVAAAKAGNLPVIERTYGVLDSPAVVEIASRITSQVTAVHVKDGQDVKAGDLLVTLDDRVLQAQLAKDKATLAKDQALLASAEADLERARTLAQKQAGTKQAYDQALAAQRAAAATVDADQAAIDSDMLQIGFTEIRAPIDGRLGSVGLAVGDLVTAGQPTTGLMTLTAMKPLKVSFRLPESVLAAVRQDMASGTSIKVRVLRSGETEPVGTGTLDFLDSAIDPSSGTIGLAATLANADLSLWPGEHVNVEVERAPLAAVALVPTVAIQPGQQGSFVWLLKDDSTVEARPVTVSRNEGSVAAVASGLAPGDKVVVEGQLRLAQGSKVKPVEQPSQEKLAGDAAAGAATP